MSASSLVSAVIAIEWSLPDTVTVTNLSEFWVASLGPVRLQLAAIIIIIIIISRA